MNGENRNVKRKKGSDSVQYRNFGKLGWKVSALGFGCMRLPTNDHISSSENINVSESISMIRQAIDQGINYVDTAYPYHGGNSETLVGKALSEGYRHKVKLATKSPTWLLQSPADFDKYLNEQLRRLQTDHIDFYLLHALSHIRWQNVILRHNILRQAEKALQEGKIGHLGFSFHDNYNAFSEIIDGYDKWELCQIQYNYMDIENQAGVKGLRYAAAKGLAVIVMEPLLGGKLANPPQPVQAIFDSLSVRQSAAYWGLQWLWNKPEVSVVLSGMSTIQQVEENLAAADQSGIGILDDSTLEAIDQVRQIYKMRFPIPCTNCSYCIPCPNGIAIPRNFELYNNAFAYDDFPASRNAYQKFFDQANRAGSCISCHACEKKCPQKIPISEWLSKVHSEFGK